MRDLAHFITDIVWARVRPIRGQWRVESRYTESSWRGAGWRFVSNEWLLLMLCQWDAELTHPYS
jgi:hypothetical protein